MKGINIAIFSLWGLVACTSNTNKKEMSNTPSELDLTLSRADSSWNVMMRSDDLKIDNMLRLSTELLLVENCDSVKLLSAKDKIRTLNEKRYTKETLGNPGIIDQYDSLTTEAVNILRDEIRKNKKAGHYQLIMQLQEEIVRADDSVLYYRKGYDQQASQLNALMNSNQNSKKTDIKGMVNGKFPLFRLIP